MDNRRVLVVDDDPSVRELLAEALLRSGYQTATASDGAAAVSVADTQKPGVALLDIRMPGGGGIDALHRLLDLDANLAIVVISSVDELDTVRLTLKSGAYDYLVKPLDIEAVLETVARAFEQRELKLEVEHYRRHLESMVQARTEALSEALRRIEAVYNQTILALGSALEMRDVETEEHSLRVADYTTVLCGALGIADDEVLLAIRRGAFLHDIGKIGVPDVVLRKPGPLTEDEWDLMRQHPEIGVHLLDRIDFLRRSVPIVRSHHERWDGSGYPDGLHGEEIPVEARAFSVADALDAITSDRPYRPGRSVDEACAIIRAGSGSQFDPEAIAAFMTIDVSEIKEIRSRYE